MSAQERRPPTPPLTVLEAGTVEIEGRLPWSSNATFLATVSFEDIRMRAVYKPYRGERPLWDFPDGLYRREVAAYLLSEALGWALVPETVARADGPLGAGSLQRFVDADFEQHYFTLLDDGRHHDALRMIGLFDLLANNADRKGGHCLLGTDGHVWAIDHGLCFHPDPKLRTVIWDFSGDPLPAPALADVDQLRSSPLPASLTAVLSDEESAALLRRAEFVLRKRRFPDPDPARRPYPWPLV